MKKLALLFTLSLVLFSSCVELFQNKVAMPQGEPGSLYELLFSQEKGGKLPAPQEIFVSLYDYSDRIKISWTPVDNAAYYRLERAVVTRSNIDGSFEVPDESEFDVLEHSKFIFGTTFIDKIISNDTNDPLDYTNEKFNYAYFYRVSAENPLESYDESDFTVSSMAALLAPPANVKGSLGADENWIQIDWKKANGATRYVIYRGLYSDGSNSMRVGSVPANQNWYKDESVDASFKGQELYYTVCAVSNNSMSSVNSSVALGYTLLPGAPPRVENVKVKDGKGRGEVLGTKGDDIVIEWSPASGTDIKYAVYRSTSKDATVRKQKDDITDTTYSDSNKIEPNTYYYYYVQAYTGVDGDYKRGPMSNSGIDSDTPAEAFILSPPSYVRVEKIDGNDAECRITFAAAIGNEGYAEDSKKYKDYNDYTYYVWGSNSESGPFDIPAWDFQAGSILPNNDGEYIGRVKACQFYKMQTEYNGKKSAMTNVVAPAPFKAEKVYASQAGKIKGYTDIDNMANENNVYPVRITWEAPNGGAAGGYYVYRSTKADSGYRKISENPIPTCEYIDIYDGAKTNTIYYYRVLSLNSLLQGVNYSDVDEPVLDGYIIETQEKAKLNDRGRGYGWGAITPYQYMREHIKTTLNSQNKLDKMKATSDIARLGSETRPGAICGTIHYETDPGGGNLIAAANGVKIYIHYDNYADFYINNDEKLGAYFFYPTGDTNTSITNVTSQSGKMFGTVTVLGMYPGSVSYDNISINGGAAAGGTYGVIRNGIDDAAVQVIWLAGEK